MTSAANCGVFDPDYAVPPGLTLADLLQEQGMSQTDLARRLGVSLKHINQVIRGSASISAELALGLEKVFGTSSAFWLSRESLYQAVLARKQERREFEKAIDWASQFPVTELKKRGLIPGDATGVDLVGQLLRFFGIARPSQWSDPAVAYRKSLKIESVGIAFNLQRLPVGDGRIRPLAWTRNAEESKQLTNKIDTGRVAGDQSSLLEFRPWELTRPVNRLFELSTFLLSCKDGLVKGLAA